MAFRNQLPTCTLAHAHNSNLYRYNKTTRNFLFLELGNVMGISFFFMSEEKEGLLLLYVFFMVEDI